MSYIINQYKKRFGEALKPLGFKLYKKTFYKVVNGTIQLVILTKTPVSCSVEFDIVSLALGIDDLYWEAGYSINLFRKGAKERDWWFEPSQAFFDRGTNTFSKIVYDEKQMDEIVEDMLTIVLSEVTPVFERGIDVKNAYSELMQIEKMIRPDASGGLRPDYGLAMLCIQAKNYDTAQQHLTGTVDKWEKAYIEKAAKHDEEGHTDDADWLYERFLLEYKELKDLFYRLSIKDTQYLDEFILKKETKSFVYLSDPRKRKKVVDGN